MPFVTTNALLTAILQAQWVSKTLKVKCELVVSVNVTDAMDAMYTEKTRTNLN